jgi:exonuclease III
MRIATWNLKQAVAPKKPLPELWRWAAECIRPDCIVFTEGKVPSSGVPSGWTAEWNPDGVYPEKRNRWGTVVAGRGVDIVPVTSVKSGWRRRNLEVTWPAAVQVVDVFDDSEYWGTVVGFYAVTKNGGGSSTGNGAYSWPTMMRQLEPLFSSDRGHRLVVAGDLNLLPKDVGRVAQSYGLTDVIDHTASTRPKLKGCNSCRRASGCHHMWTHKNTGGANPSIQQVDYIFVSEDLVGEIRSVKGGSADFPDAWDASDHAPVVVDFR